MFVISVDKPPRPAPTDATTVKLSTDKAVRPDVRERRSVAQCLLLWHARSINTSFHQPLTSEVDKAESEGTWE